MQSVPFIKKKAKDNYVNFHSLFFFSFFFTNFFYPLVLYPIDPQFFSVYTLYFNEDFINSGTALAQLSLSSYMVGAEFVKHRLKKKHKNKVFYDHTTVVKFSILLFALFVATVGSAFLSGNFDAHSSFSLYVLQLLTCAIVLSSILVFKTYKPHKKLLYYIMAGVYILLFLSIGDRGPALSLIVLFVGLYTTYKRVIPIRYLLPFGFAGIFLMHLIGQGRTTDIDDISGNVISRGMENVMEDSDETNPWFEATGGFVVNNRNLYVGMDYVDKHGLIWEETKIGSFLAIIPFVQQFYEKLTDDRLQTSSSFFTELAFGPRFPYGLGTNMVADVYISFGLIGCMLLFFLFGRIVEYLRLQVLHHTNDIFVLIAYFTLFSYSVYYPRTMLLMPLKFIVWTYAIYYGLTQLKLLRVRKLRKIKLKNRP